MGEWKVMILRMKGEGKEVVGRMAGGRGGGGWKDGGREEVVGRMGEGKRWLEG